MKLTVFRVVVVAGLLAGATGGAEERRVKPAIRGLVSMGAFKFVGSGGDPVNTLEYDSWPLLREVSMTSCMSFTAEPFYSPNEDAVQEPIRAAGFTVEAYKECLRGALDDYAAWQSTRIVLSVNPLRTAPGQGAGDQEFTMDIMRECRKTLGVRCVFDNHNLDTKLPRPLHPLYDLMKKLGPEIAFQTGGTNPEDFEGTIKLGVEYGATSIELWQDYRGFPEVPIAKLKKWAAMVEANDTR